MLQFERAKRVVSVKNTTVIIYWFNDRGQQWIQSVWDSLGSIPLLSPLTHIEDYVNEWENYPSLCTFSFIIHPKSFFNWIIWWSVSTCGWRLKDLWVRKRCFKCKTLCNNIVVQLMLESYYFNAVIVAGFIISIGAGYFLMTFIYSAILWWDTALCITRWKYDITSQSR